MIHVTDRGRVLTTPRWGPGEWPSIVKVPTGTTIDANKARAALARSKDNRTRQGWCPALIKTFPSPRSGERAETLSRRNQHRLFEPKGAGDGRPQHPIAHRCVDSFHALG